MFLHFYLVTYYVLQQRKRFLLLVPVTFDDDNDDDVFDIKVAFVYFGFSDSKSDQPIKVKVREKLEYGKSVREMEI
jgi:hypothetical protein